MAGASGLAGAEAQTAKPSNIADSRPIALNDPVARSSHAVFFVNFRAGNNSGCLENNQ
jgi:hypothetical protein